MIEKIANINELAKKVCSVNEIYRNEKKKIKFFNVCSYQDLSSEIDIFSRRKCNRTIMNYDCVCFFLDSVIQLDWAIKNGNKYCRCGGIFWIVIRFEENINYEEQLFRKINFKDFSLIRKDTTELRNTQFFEYISCVLFKKYSKPQSTVPILKIDDLAYRKYILYFNEIIHNFDIEIEDAVDLANEQLLCNEMQRREEITKCQEY